MSSPQPERLHVVPTPRGGGNATSANSGGPSWSTSLISAERHPNALVPSNATSPPQLQSSTSISPPPQGRITQPSTTTHHVWSIGTPKRQKTKSALRSSSVLSRHQSDLNFPTTIGSGWANGSLPEPSLSLLGLDDQEVHYGVAGYRAEAGGVSFYRTSIHKKDPQNIILSHGRVSGRIVDLPDHSGGGTRHNGTLTSPAVWPPSAPVTLEQSQLQQHIATQSTSPLLVRYRGSNPSENPLPPTAAQTQHIEMDRSSLLSGGAGGVEGLMTASSGRRRHSPVSTGRPRWNTSPRGGVNATAVGNTSAGRPLATTTTMRVNTAHMNHPHDGVTSVQSLTAPTSAASSRHASFAATHEVVSGAPPLSTPVSVRIGTSSSPAAQRSLRQHVSPSKPNSGTAAMLQAPLPTPIGAPSGSSTPPPHTTQWKAAHHHHHDCRDERCIHNRSDIMDVIVAKSQVRAVESQLLHEEIRREQLASALSAERERSAQLRETLHRLEKYIEEQRDSSRRWKDDAEAREAAMSDLQQRCESLERALEQERGMRASAMASATSLDDQLKTANRELHAVSLERQQLRKELASANAASSKVPVAALPSAAASTSESVSNASTSMHTLEAEVARLREERVADERLRRELLRALTDKERQIASISASLESSKGLPRSAGPPVTLSPAAATPSGEANMATLQTIRDDLPVNNQRGQPTERHLMFTAD